MSQKVIFLDTLVCSMGRNIEMTTFERIKFLANKQGKNLKTVATDLGFSENALYKWKNQSPTTENLSKVADYFGVSLDYLVGRKEESLYTETDLAQMVDNAMSFDGQPINEHDKEVIMAFLKGRYGIE